MEHRLAAIRAAVRNILYVKSDNHTDSWEADDWNTAIVRVEADNGVLSMVGPYGSATVAADIEERGVLFCRIREFVETVDKLFCDETVLHFFATDRRAGSQQMAFLCQPWEWKLFRDPALAPKTWTPTPPPKDDWLLEAEEAEEHAEAE